MNFNFFKKKKEKEIELNLTSVELEWNNLGSTYASEINKMIEFGDTHGWEHWKGKEAIDHREHLADIVVSELRKANEYNDVLNFRTKFPPAHDPFIKYFEEKGVSMEHLHFIENEKIIFLIGTAYQKRQAYLLDNTKIIELDPKIDAVGKSKRNNVFGILTGDRLTTTQGWQGEIIQTFELKKTKGLGVSELIPFNDGNKVLLITSEGIFLLSAEDELMIHPIKDPEDEEWESNIDMENGTISNDNKILTVGDQCSTHRILDINGTEIGSIGQQSEYSHFCLFSKDDSQLITNSCHFYNGITVAVDREKLPAIEIEEYQESDQYKTIDDQMRVYAGIAINNYYILGDAYGTIRAIDKEGNLVWRHYLGSTITGITISDDEKTLWVGACTGMIHKLQLGAGHRDDHTIGTGNHFEEFRLIAWQNEPMMFW